MAILAIPLVSMSQASTDCIACERLVLFQTCVEQVNNDIWESINAEHRRVPLLYFTDENTYVAFGDHVWFDAPFETMNCEGGLALQKYPRLDTPPFHMQNKMHFSDTTSPFYYRPMMLCSDVETLHAFVPDFENTEDWLQLVMHEYFHSFQFVHPATIRFLADSIQISADTLNRIYLKHEWFQESLEKENAALLNALRCASQDSLNYYVDIFFDVRESRRSRFARNEKFKLAQHEEFWETIEGTARYAEYYMAGSFSHMPVDNTMSCDTTFRRFAEYQIPGDFEREPEFIERTKMMQAYYYVTGFNLCRLLDKMRIHYKADLFNHAGRSLSQILEEMRK